MRLGHGGLARLCVLVLRVTGKRGSALRCPASVRGRLFVVQYLSEIAPIERSAALP
jgi:hypothetical protein